MTINSMGCYVSERRVKESKRFAKLQGKTLRSFLYEGSLFYWFIIPDLNFGLIIGAKILRYLLLQYNTYLYLV